MSHRRRRPRRLPGDPTAGRATRFSISGAGIRTTDPASCFRPVLDLVDDDHVDLPRPDIVQQLLERRPLHRPARKAAIVIAFADELPSLMGLAFDVGFGGLALVVESVEVLLQTRVGGDARIDGAAKGDLALVPFSSSDLLDGLSFSRELPGVGTRVLARADLTGFGPAHAGWSPSRFVRTCRSGLLRCEMRRTIGRCGRESGVGWRHANIEQ